MSIETRKKISEKRKGFIFSDKSKQKMCNSQKKVIILDFQTGVFYCGYKDATMFSGIKRTTLSEQLNGRNNNKTNLKIV